MSRKLLINNNKISEGTPAEVTLEISKGYYNGGSGVKASHTYISGYIATLEPDKNYVILTCNGWNNTDYPDLPCTLHVSFWDKDLKFITGSTIARQGKIDIPDNACYIRIGHDVRRCNGADIHVITF